MSWNAPVPATTGELYTASRYNTDVIGNLLFLKTSIGGAGDLWTGNVSKVLQGFRGLRLRTHTDQDLSPTKIVLTGLDEIVMSDGHRYQPAGIFPLVGDLGVSGAGGLDTGAKVASTWYETYLVGKSIPGADADLRLLFHRAKDYFKDTSYETPFDTSNGLRLAGGGVKFSQGFKLATAGKVEFVEAPIQHVASVTGNVWFTIEADVSGNASGAPLATSDKLSATVMYAGINYIRFRFRAPATLAATTQYHLVLNGDYTVSSTNFVTWASTVNGTYANGSARTYDGTSWFPIGAQDFLFKVFVTRNESALVLPTGYDESQLVGFAYNNSSNIFSPFLTYDRRYRHLTVKQFGNGVIGGAPIIADLSTMVPPRQLVVDCTITSNSVANNFVAGMPDGYNYQQLITGFEGGASIASTSGSVGGWANLSPVLTETQAVYMASTAGTAIFVLTGFQW